MNAFSPKLLGCLAVLTAWAVLANAQSVIQYSEPADTAGAEKWDKPEELTKALSGSKNLSANDYAAPTSAFGNSMPRQNFDRLTMGPAYATESTQNAKKWKQFLDGRKNWALLTPEQILGVQTPEQILGIADLKDKAKNNPNLTAEERYLLRQSSFSSLSGGATNAGGRYASLFQADSQSSLFGSPDQRDKLSDYSKADLGGGKDLNQALRMTARSSPFGAGRNYAGGNPFGQSATVQKPDAAQLEGMERFRALLGSDTPVEKPVVSTVFSSPTTLSRPTTGLGKAPSASMPPVALDNPVGRSFKPLTSELSKPVGITPLSGVTRPLTAPTAKSSTAPKPPPWLTDSTQPFKHF